MIKTVFELLSEIYKGNIDELPNKIKVDDIIWEKDKFTKDYLEKDTFPRQYLLEYLFKRDTREALELKIEEVKEEKRKPKFGEEYYYVTEEGDISDYKWTDTDIDNYMFYNENCFKTKAEAKQCLENIKIGVEIRKIAEKLNKGEKINWSDNNQNKYFLFYDYENKEIKINCNQIYKVGRTIYCLSESLKSEAIRQIGEEKVANYLKEI